MKRLLFIACMLLVASNTMACAVCESQQPRLLKGITHGTGPESKWDYLIVSAMLTVVLLTLFFSIKWIIRPGEKSENHIKNFILNNP